LATCSVYGYTLTHKYVSLLFFVSVAIVDRYWYWYWKDGMEEQRELVDHLLEKGDIISSKLATNMFQELFPLKGDDWSYPPYSLKNE